MWLTRKVAKLGLAIAIPLGFAIFAVIDILRDDAAIGTTVGVSTIDDIFKGIECRHDSITWIWIKDE